MPKIALFQAATLLALAASTSANSNYLTGTVGNTSIAGNGTGQDANGKFVISTNGIRAYFIPYGASITNLFVNDSNGIERDVVVGYDNASAYWLHGNQYLGGVTGRYSNRIANASFILDGTQYHTIANNGNSTLHDGPDGWDARNWTLVAHTTDSITFSITDQTGEAGFPGNVIAYVTHTVVDYPKPRWIVRMVALSVTQTSPIMLASRAHWNLDAFANPNTSTIYNHTLALPFSGQRVNVDPYLVPDGSIAPNKLYSVNDFWSAASPKQLGRNLTKFAGNCGQNCTGYDNCMLINRDALQQAAWYLPASPVATLRSTWSGIRLNVYTDQSAVQLYTCNAMDGTIPLKSSQGLSTRARVVQQHGCVGLEFEDWIGGINNPEWGRQPKQVFGPGDPPFVLQAVYEIYASTSTPTCTSTSAPTTRPTQTSMSMTTTH